MNTNSIFISHTDNTDQETKITYTNIMEIIPPNSLNKPLVNWQTMYKTEWRWRFLKFSDKKVVEISYTTNTFNKRIYYNKFGQWVERNEESMFDKYVIEQYYYYTKE